MRLPNVSVPSLTRYICSLAYPIYQLPRLPIINYAKHHNLHINVIDLMKKEMNKGLSFKIILLGDHSTGKTALIQKYIHGLFKDQFNVTVGAEFSSKMLEVEGNHLQLQIWDTSGQDVYRSITKSFYRGVAAVFLVYSVDNRESFEHLQEWLDDFYQKGSKEAFVFVVGTKNDLKSVVSSEKALEFMKRIEGAFYIETSSKQSQNVKILFEKAAESMYKLYTISPEYRELVNFDKLSKTKGSVVGSSGLSLQEMRNTRQLSRRNKCC